MPKPLPADLLELLHKPSPCFVATLMPDGSPQLTETWVSTDGTHIVINIVEGLRKAKNIARDPRVALSIADPADIARHYAVRGRVVGVTAEGGRENIDEISHKYLGVPYPGFRGVPETRLIVTIEADSITTPMG